MKRGKKNVKEKLGKEHNKTEMWIWYGTFEMGLVEQRRGEIIKIKPQSQTANDID